MAEKKAKKLAKKTSISRTSPSKKNSEISQSFVALPKFVKSRTTMSIASVLVGVALLLVLGNRYFIVAWVDQKPITRIDYYKALGQKYGNDVREQLIVEKLVEAEAQKKGIKITPQNIDNEIKKIETDQGGKDKLNQILQVQNISQGEFRKLVRLQILKQKLFENNVTIKDEDVNKYIQENQAQLELSYSEATQSTPDAQKQLKEKVKNQLKLQKVNEEFNNWLRSALQGPRVSRVK